MDYSEIFAFVAALAGGFGAGFLNSVAGGGTLIVFPVLLASGISPLTANVTCTVALSVGYIGGIKAQFAEIKGLGNTIYATSVAAALGSLIGAYILIATGESNFEAMVPWLLFGAALLLAFTSQIKALIFRHQNGPSHHWLVIPVFLAAIYGGYFGAGMSIIVLAVLGLWSGEPMNILNAHKQTIGLAVNGVAAAFFLSLAPVDHQAAVAIALGSITGGWLGGKMANRVNPELLRWGAVIVGVGSGLYYL